MNAGDEAPRALLQELARTARGPRREGVFALWLAVRVALDVASDPSIADRAHRRRVLALEKRLSSLTLAPPLRRALAATLAQLRELRPEAAALAITQLVAPARDTVGTEAGEAVQRAAREAQTRVAASVRGR